MSEAGQSVALDGWGAVGPLSKQQVMDQELVWEETGKVGILTFFWLPLWLLQQHHHHVHREQPVDHLQEEHIAKS